MAWVEGRRRSHATRWKPFSAFPSMRRTTWPAASFTVSTTAGFLSRRSASTAVQPGNGVSFPASMSGFSASCRVFSRLRRSSARW